MKGGKGEEEGGSFFPSLVSHASESFLISWHRSIWTPAQKFSPTIFLTSHLCESIEAKGTEGDDDVEMDDAGAGNAHGDEEMDDAVPLCRDLDRGELRHSKLVSAMTSDPPRKHGEGCEAPPCAGRDSLPRKTLDIPHALPCVSIR